MDKPIPEAVSVTLHQDRTGCEWIIVTSKDHPGSESEVTPSDDPALFDLLKALTAAQQQGQAVACWCLTCRPQTLADMRFVVCPDCGNKRCPHANDHRNSCTGSNEPGQLGSAHTQPTQQGGGEVIQRHVVTKYRDGSVHVADVAAPPSAPVGVEVRECLAALASFIDPDNPDVSIAELTWLDRAHWLLAQQPAATYSTPDDVQLNMGPDDVPRLLIAGAEVAQFPKGSWEQVCEALDFGGYRHEQPAAVGVDDTRCMDWLERHAVEVRTPMRYGSAALFHAEQVSDDDEPYRTNLRAQIAAALAQQPAADFDTWQQNPYTKVLMKSIAEDYVPKHDQQPAAVDGNWRQKAAEWLEAKAVEQEANNQRWPDHAAAYKEWRDRPGVLRYLAAQVLATQHQEPTT